MSAAAGKGTQFEGYARDYLVRQGLRMLGRNYRCRFGEIDLIMRDHDTICFVEVKFRKTQSFGGAASAISHSKQRRIIKTALFYISQNRALANQAFRFDALLIQQMTDQSNQINWIKNAFYAD